MSSSKQIGARGLLKRMLRAVNDQRLSSYQTLIWLAGEQLEHCCHGLVWCVPNETERNRVVGGVVGNWRV